MVEFSSLEELRNKINPVLIIKKNEFFNNGIYVNEDIIFNFLTENKWKKSNDLRFFQIISDIIRLDGDDIIEKE